MKLLPIIFSISLFVGSLSAAEPENPVFIDNGTVRLGIDRESGGSVFYFSQSEPRLNLLNHHDRGRFVQQSFYGRRDGSKWVEKDWRWNPVQGGDYKGKPAELLELDLKETSLYAKSIPTNWAGGESLEECRMEQWIDLHDDVAHLRYRFTYSGEEKHPPHPQEMPAVFVDYAFENLVRYEGDAPWTGGKLTNTVPGWPNESHSIDENWAAYVDGEGRGIGVLVPGTTVITSYRFKGEAGPNGGGCSYFAPLRTFAIVPGTVVEYHVYLTLGTAEQIRDRFGEIAKSLEKGKVDE